MDLPCFVPHTSLVKHYCHMLFPSLSSLCFIQDYCVELECCGRTLAELIVAVQELGRRHPLLSKQLSDSIAKLGEIHHHTLRLAEYRSGWLKKVVTKIINCTGFVKYCKMLEITIFMTEKLCRQNSSSFMYHSL